jgi:diacylglycerol O-acyltransferase / wax synthase
VTAIASSALYVIVSAIRTRRSPSTSAPRSRIAPIVWTSLTGVTPHHSMSAADAAWLHMDRSTNLMVVNSVLWFDEPMDWRLCRAMFLERVVGRFDRFRQRAVEGPPLVGPHWEDDPDFDPELHFHHIALPAPHDRRALQEMISDRIVTPLDRDRPLWEVYFIDGYAAGCAILVRIHHGIADGIALARVMLTLTDGGETGSSGIAEPEARDGHGSSRLSEIGPLVEATGALAREGIRALLHPSRAAELARARLEDAQTLAKLILPWSDPRSAVKGEQRQAHRVAWSEPIELWRVKRAGRAFGATVNDVLVAAVAGAVGGHLRARGDAIDEIHALVPFNLRPLDRPLPAELGNRFALVLLALPVGIEDPVARVAVVKHRMGAIKRSHEGAIAYGILGLIGRTPAAVEHRLIDFFSAKSSMVLTNVPGPQRPLSLAGTPLGGVLVWAPCSGSVGMSVSVFSYARKVTVGFLVDAGLVPDPEALARGFRADVLALARHAATART